MLLIVEYALRYIMHALVCCGCCVLCYACFVLTCVQYDVRPICYVCCVMNCILRYVVCSAAC